MILKVYPWKWFWLHRACYITLLSNAFGHQELDQIIERECKNEKHTFQFKKKLTEDIELNKLQKSTKFKRSGRDR